MDLCVTVFSRLGSRHVDNLARTFFNNNKTILSQCRALCRDSVRGTSTGAFESVLMLHGAAVSNKFTRAMRTVTGQ